MAPPEGFTTKEYLPPLGIGYMAAVLEKAGHEVMILDTPILHWSIEEIIKEIQNKNPDLLGITATSHSRFNAIKIIDGVKGLNCLKVLGGVHFGSTDVDALQHIPADVVVRGEGEYTILDIANNVPFDKILGITYREDGNIVRTPDRPFLDLNELPFPARHLFPMSKYNAKLEGEYKTKCASIITSRGCPNKCVFCVNKSFWKQRFRRRDATSVVDEIEHIISRYNIYGFDFWDDTFTLVPAHVQQICNEIIKRRLDIKWYARIRVDTVNRSILELMKEAGCRVVSYGIESGSPRILDVIRKNITLDQVRECTRLCSKLGFHVKVFFMFNHPTEKIRDIEATILLMDEIRQWPNVSIKTAMTYIYPGTEIEQIAKDEGILPRNFSWNSPYYSQRNKDYKLSPAVPCFEHIPFEDLIPFIQTGSVRTLLRRGIKQLTWVKNVKDLYNLYQKAQGLLLNKVRTYIKFDGY